MSTEPIDIQVTDSVAPSIVPTLKDIAQNARESYSALATLQDALDSVNGSALNTLTQASQTASSSLKETSNAQTTLTDTTKTSSAATTQFAKDAEKATVATTAWGNSLTFLRGFLGALIGGLSIKFFLDQAEAYTKLSDKLRDVTKDYNDYHNAQTRLFAIAQKTHQTIEATTGLFVGLSKATAGTSITQNELFRTTELIDKAMLASGKSSEVASNAIRTFAVGLGQGRTAGMAMRQLLIEFPLLGKAVADGLRVSSQELVRMAQAGTLTIEKFNEGLNNSAKMIEDKAARATLTISMAFVNLQNAVHEYIGKADQASGITSILARGIIFLSQHLDVLAGIVGLVALRFGILLAINVGSFFLTMAETALKAGAAMALGLLTPTGLVTVAVLAAVVAIGYFTGSLDFLIAKTTEAGKAIGDSLNKRVEESVGQFKSGTDSAQKFSGAIATLTDRIKAADTEFKETSDTIRQNTQAVERMRLKWRDYYQCLMDGAITTEQATIDLQKQAVSVSNAAKAYDQLASSASAAAAAETRASTAFDASPGGGGSGVKGGAGGVSLFPGYEEAYQFYNKWKDAYQNLEGWMRLMGYTGQIQAFEALGDTTAAEGLRRRAAEEFQRTPFASLTAEDALQNIRNRTGIGGAAGLPQLQHFAGGGEFTVGGRGGTDSQLVQIWASPDETVSVKTPAQKREEDKERKPGRAMINMPITIITPDHEGFRRNKTQLSATLASQIAKASRRLGV